MGSAYRDGVPVQVGGDLPQVQQLLLGQEAGLSPDGVQDGSRMALSEGGVVKGASAGEPIRGGRSHHTLKAGPG